MSGRELSPAAKRPSLILRGLQRGPRKVCFALLWEVCVGLVPAELRANGEILLISRGGRGKGGILRNRSVDRGETALLLAACKLLFICVPRL